MSQKLASADILQTKIWELSYNIFSVCNILYLLKLDVMYWASDSLAAAGRERDEIVSDKTEMWQEMSGETFGEEGVNVAPQNRTK